ncbi:MAG: TIGR04283 family arsenosugar biosynthesis glycosyltransferase [candidate division KSB1 bacterium]|nr:TIGR04283 family arsenosugar biosynthesis glycosyltransferase [candidate division KSB1 bacterium]
MKKSTRTDDLSISVIIPTLNEEKNVAELLKYLKNLDERLELIVADAGSQDGTAARARRLSRMIESPRGRGIQMNKGAQAATGEVLWFLHADCRPHPDSLPAMLAALSDPHLVGGGFEYNLDHPSRRFRWTEFFSNRKNRMLTWLFGDMGIFVRRPVFERMGGYKEIPLMEDMDFSKRLKEEGNIVILPLRINTSARRWLEEGYIYHSIRSWVLQSAWRLGASPETLARFYTFK